ncbi:MAG TPA: multicopper oxidase domain-containing protein, partial [Burkholderiales bacterium]|nr:multicopper oxidase domain-containing protein [Burkholderiales bacterium]
MNKSRRRLVAGTGAAALAGAAGWGLWQRRAVPEAPRRVQLPPDPLFPNPLNVPGEDGLHGILDVGASFTIVSAPVQREILPGKSARMLAYAVDHGGRTLVNPVIRMATGTNVRVRYWNALDETSIVHWHGLKVDTNNDGHPHYAVGAGQTYDYQFTVANRGGTYWYHPHPHHLAGKQAYLGLAGLLLVEDADEIALERALDLKLGETDIPLLIQDKRFAEDGTLSYAPGAQDHFLGYCGDRVLVNLTDAPCFDCESRLYRFRLVNGSNARIYRLAFTHGDEALEFQVVGADGGLLEKPIAARELFLSPSERADVLLDLRTAALGERVMLASLPFDAMQFATKGHAQHSAGAGAVPANGAPLDLMLIRVTEKVDYEREVPAVLSQIAATESEALKTRRFAFDHAKGMWRINGYSYRMTDTAFSVDRGAREIWEFRNSGPAMPHPIHIHG